MLPILVLFACAIAITKAADVAPLIVGGHDASLNQFPYQVSLQQNGQHFCGGSILSRTKILTAAHCIYGNNQLIIVVAGSITISTFIGIPVIRGVYHPSYDPLNYYNDVAVLTILLPLVYLPNIQPVTLPISDPVNGSVLTLSGWGLTSYPGNVSKTLQYIHLTALDFANCQQQIDRYTLAVGQICTTSPVNQGACQGDSGGPLVNEANQQVGIVSIGVPCATGIPDIFTSVTSYKSWILSQ